MWPVFALMVAAAPGPMRVAVTEFQLSGVERATGDLFETQFANQLTRHRGLSVTSRQDIQRMLGLERQRQLLGCENSTSCLAELMGALGANAIVTASIGKVGEALGAGHRLRVQRERLPFTRADDAHLDEPGLVEAVGRAADDIAEQLVGPEPLTARQLAWVPLVGGVLFAGGGAVSLVLSQTLAKSFTVQGRFQGQAAVNDAVALGKLEQTLGYVGLGVGGAALISSALMFALGAPPPLTASFQVTPQGGAFALGGTW